MRPKMRSYWMVRSISTNSLFPNLTILSTVAPRHRAPRKIVHDLQRNFLQRRTFPASSAWSEAKATTSFQSLLFTSACLQAADNHGLPTPSRNRTQFSMVPESKMTAPLTPTTTRDYTVADHVRMASTRPAPRSSTARGLTGVGLVSRRPGGFGGPQGGGITPRVPRKTQQCSTCLNGCIVDE